VYYPALLCNCYAPHNISSTLNLHLSPADRSQAGALVSTLEASRLLVRSMIQGAEGYCIFQSWMWDLGDKTLSKLLWLWVLFVPLPPHYSVTLVKWLALVFRFIFLENKAVCSVNMHVPKRKGWALQDGIGSLYWTMVF